MSAPLAQRMRPQTIDDIVGQRHLLGEGKPLRNIILSGELPNMVFYGPSGVGKTTLASIIAKTTDRHLVKLNGTTSRHKGRCREAQHICRAKRHSALSRRDPVF